MKLISLNVARPRLTVYKGETINTGIFKKPVSGRIALRTLNLDGDQQADLSVHGGPYKAVYAYPSEHYGYLARRVAQDGVAVGHVWREFYDGRSGGRRTSRRRPLSSRFVTLMVRQPRMPCYKLAAKFQRDDMIERFLLSGRSGFYFSVEQEGEVGVGDFFELDLAESRWHHHRRNEPAFRSREIQSRSVAEGDCHGRTARDLA